MSTPSPTPTLAGHQVVSRDEWIAARKRHLQHEKELTRMRDRLAEERRALPWVRVDKTYTFDTPDGPRALAELFGANSQLVVYSFMLAPGAAQGCSGCSFMADHLQGPLVHLQNHDVSVRLVARAPVAEIAAYWRRMGWTLPYASAGGTDFSLDYGVQFTPEQLASKRIVYNYEEQDAWGEDLHGMHVFYKDPAGAIFHTYSSYARGADALLTTYGVLDLTPKGRNEASEMSDWMRRHDEYPQPAAAAGHACCR